MALSANTVWEIRTAGNDTNGGGFVTGSGGVDYSQQDAKRSATGTNDSTTDAVANGTTTITSATANFDANIVGNIVYFQGGTGGIAAVWRQVTARTNATTITIDASIAASTGMTMNVGGALASLGMCGASVVGSNVIHMKSGAYSITSASTNISGGCFSKASTNISIYGYTTTRQDMGATRPVLTATGAISSFTIVSGGAASVVANIEVDGASKTSSRGFNWSGITYKCKASNCTNTGFLNASFLECYICEATGCSGNPAFSAPNFAWGCVAHDNTVTGFGGNGSVYVNCIADTNTGGTTDGFTSGGAMKCINCVAYANGRDGFRAASSQSSFINCIAETNTGVGINCSSLNACLVANCATYNNGTAITNTGAGSVTTGSITGTGSFFTNAANADFSLNNTAGAGATVRATGLLGAFPGGTTTGYLDVGAAQHQDTGGGGGSTMTFYGGA